MKLLHLRYINALEMIPQKRVVRNSKQIKQDLEAKMSQKVLPGEDSRIHFGTPNKVNLTYRGRRFQQFQPMTF